MPIEQSFGALKFRIRGNLAFRSTNSTLTNSPKFKFFAKSNIFSRSSILRQFLISSSKNKNCIGFQANLGFFELLEPNFFNSSGSGNWERISVDGKGPMHFCQVAKIDGNVLVSVKKEAFFQLAYSPYTPQKIIIFPSKKRGHFLICFSLKTEGVGTTLCRNILTFFLLCHFPDRFAVLEFLPPSITKLRDAKSVRR